MSMWVLSQIITIYFSIRINKTNEAIFYVSFVQ